MRYLIAYADSMQKDERKFRVRVMRTMPVWKDDALGCTSREKKENRTKRKTSAPLWVAWYEVFETHRKKKNGSVCINNSDDLWDVVKPFKIKPLMAYTYEIPK
jgi:hypothetical protein